MNTWAIDRSPLLHGERPVLQVGTLRIGIDSLEEAQAILDARQEDLDDAYNAYEKWWEEE